MPVTDNKHNLLYSKWLRLGYGFVGKSHSKPIDLEKLILDTLEFTRKDSRLFICLISWVAKNFDLINNHRLIRLSKNYDTSILGFTFATVHQEVKDQGLEAVLKHCQKKRGKEIFFEIMGKKKFTQKIEVSESSSLAKKWGFYCREQEFRTELVEDREVILNKNKNLAIRAFFGNNIKSEIINYLREQGEGYIKRIADELSLGYFPTHKEFSALARNNILEYKTVGRKKMFRLGEGAKKVLRAI